MLKKLMKYMAGMAEAGNIPWKSLTSEDQLDEIVARSHEKPVLIYKHSTRCGVSAMAKGQLEQEWIFSEDEIEPYFLDLIRYRAVSNEIARRFQVTHQSPQVLLIQKGECIYHQSHMGISAAEMKKKLKAS